MGADCFSARFTRWFLGIGLVVWLAVNLQGRLSAADAEVDFAHDVVPILRQHCVGCHGGKESKGGFSLNTRGLVLEAEVVDLKNVDGSRLIQLIESHDPEDQMPPKDRPRLSAKEASVLRRWIALGVNWEPGFTFAASTYEPPLAPRRPELPAPVDGRTNPVDRIVDSYLAALQVNRPAPLDDRQFLRRVTLDLVGLLPTEEQLKVFVADSAADKRAKMVDALLADRENYATHWLSFWNDLLRNAYSGTGYIDGGRQQITEWLYGALYHNLAYDQFVRELIAPAPQAAGFIQGIQWRGNVNASQKREIQFAQSVSQVFLGINMKCASCHDSFIDRWKLEETYALAAIFSNETLELHRCDKPQGTMAKAAWIFPELGQIDPQAPQPARLLQLASLMTHPQNGRLSRTIVNRLWDRLMGHGIVHPVDAMHTEPWSEDLLDYLAVSLTDQRYDVKQVLRLIVTSSTYQSQSIGLEAAPEQDSFVFAGPLAKRMTAEQFIDGIRAISNNWPGPQPNAFERDGRNQRGQLRDVLVTFAPGKSLEGLNSEQLQQLWGERPIRAAFTDLDTLQAVLGRPIREQVVSARPSDLTSLQAINLANGPELADLLRNGAAKLMQRPGMNPESLVDGLYLAALSREPTTAERNLAVEMLGSELTAGRVEDFLWVIFMLPEFQLVR